MELVCTYRSGASSDAAMPEAMTPSTLAVPEAMSTVPAPFGNADCEATTLVA
jgi:hypothetical protein